MSEKSSEDQAGDRLRESMSVTLDGQASEFELRRVLDGVRSDKELRQVACRYRQIGDAIRGEVNEFASVDLTANIMGAIEQEEIDDTVASRSFSSQMKIEQTKSSITHTLDGWWSSLGRVAMAASIAFAVVFGVNNLNTASETEYLAVNEPTTLSQPVVLTRGSQNGYGASSVKAGYNSKEHDSVTPEQLAYAQSVADMATRERFRAYALQHAELSAINNGQGVLPFARLTSFDAQ